MSISIVMPVRGRLDLTRQCVAAIEQHTPAELYELVVVDNGSTDGTLAWLDEAERAGRLRALRNGENVGFGRACDLGAAASSGTHVLLLNNDTLPLRSWLEPLLEAASEPDVGIAGSRLLFPNGTVQHAGISFDSESLPYHLARGRAKDHSVVLTSRDVAAVTGACMLLRREVYEQLGGFDDAYFFYVEDIDLCVRAWAAGLRVVYRAESTVVHLESASVTDDDWKGAGVREGWRRLHERWLGRWPEGFAKVRADENAWLADETPDPPGRR
jgi:O-antigen biosynthesis protein